MLVLARRVGESLVIGGNIWITVCKISGRQVHLGIDAPQSIAINRYEIHQKILELQPTIIDQAVFLKSVGGFD
ncbi:carbon storage regulator [Legionella sp.]|uniref:carbon storage regulator n=1 Tax=Legionella sp. TaxID=459 RepID=UPI00322055A7